MSAPLSHERRDRWVAIERQHGLFDHRVDGWSAWRVLRFPVHQLIEGLPLSTPALPQARRLADAAVATLKLIWLLLRGCRREIIVKTYRSALRVAEGEQFSDVYFDPLLHGPLLALKLEVVNSGAFDRQAAAAWRRPDLDAVVFTFWGRVLGRLWPVPDGGFSERTAMLLATEAGLPLTAAWLKLRLSTTYWQVRLYGLLLDRVQPRAVMVADSGDFALLIACRRRGIRFIELQHGVFDAEHPDAVPSWVQGSDAELVIPEHLACFGRYWIDRLAGTRQGGAGAIAVGSALIDAARVRRRSATPQAVFHLVVTSQGLDSDRLAAWLNELADRAPAGLAWRMSVKLHPAYDECTRAFDALKSKAGVDVIDGAALPNVFDLLVAADLHLSIASACHYDAAALGVPSIVIPLAGHEAMWGALQAPVIRLATSPASVWAMCPTPALDEATSTQFAEPGCVRNLERLVA